VQVNESWLKVGALLLKSGNGQAQNAGDKNCFGLVLDGIVALGRQMHGLR
jgi:hypothetical protein